MTDFTKTFHPFDHQFTRIGPGGGGAQFLPTVSPHDTNTVMLCTDMTGGFLTRNAGENWRRFNLLTRLDAIRFDPVDPKTAYVGTSGLFRSRDGGESWNLIFPNPDMIIEERQLGDEAINIFLSKDSWPGIKDGSTRILTQYIEIDPDDTNRLYVGLLSDKASAEVCFFESDDCGASFRELLRVPGAKALCIYADVSAPLDRRDVYFIADTGIWRSRAGLAAPERVPLPDGIGAFIAASCAYNADAGHSVFYVTGVDAQGRGRAYTSVDGAATWREITEALERALPRPQAGMTRVYNLIDACDKRGNAAWATLFEYPSDVRDAWSKCTQYAIYRTLDEGETWQCALNGSPSETPANYQSGWVERNYDASWNLVGPKGSFLLTLGAAPDDPDICYVTDLGATYRTLDGGKTFKSLYSVEHNDGSSSSNGMDVITCYGVHFDPHDVEHMAISYTDCGLFHSLNGGRSWLHSMNNIPRDWGNTCYWVVFDPDVPGRAWSAWGGMHDLPVTKMHASGMLQNGAGGVARTEDGMRTWDRQNSGLPVNSLVTHLLLDENSPAGNRTLWACVYTKGVYKSTDDGRTWRPSSRGIAFNFNAYRINRGSDGTLYLVTTREIEDGEVLFTSQIAKGYGTFGRHVNGAIYSSRNGGGSWQRIELPQNVNGPRDLVPDPFNNDRLYLACWSRTIDRRQLYGGAYISEDGGKSWQLTFDERAHCASILAHPSIPGRAYMNTFNGSAWRTDDGGYTWKRIPGYDFKWGQRIFLDPYNEGMLYITSFGSSVLHGPDSV